VAKWLIDPDTVWGGEWGRAWYGVLDGSMNCRRGRSSLGLNLGLSIETVMRSSQITLRTCYVIV